MKSLCKGLGWALLGCLPGVLGAEEPLGLNLTMQGATATGDISLFIQLSLFFLVLSLAPTLIILMTSFTRIVIVLGFARNALGVTQAPSNQILIGMSLFLTFFLMTPVWDKVHNEAVVPYNEKTLTSTEAFGQASNIMRTFMLKQTRPKDVEFFLTISSLGPTPGEKLPMHIVIPAFVLSELHTAFKMGFLVFLPFLVIDFLVASALMAMGMMMMPPALIALPFKILLFVLVDGWYLIVRSLVESFRL